MKSGSTILLSLLMANCQCNGFAPVQVHYRQQTTTLEAIRNNNNNEDSSHNNKGPKAAAAALLLGYTLIASPVAGIAAEASLDFSLPKYDTSMSTFGDGKEARLYDQREMTDPGANEREKQAESMRKAEEARKERVAKEKAEAKAREEEAARRAKEKKARDAERLKNIWAN